MKYITKVLLWIILIMIVAGALGWWMYQHDEARDIAEKSSTNNVVFICSEQDSIQANFQGEAVNLQLSDGRRLMLKRARSASGARYTNDDESIVFWNKGNTAFITEGDSTTYQHCVVKGQDDLVNLELFKNDDLQFRYPAALQKYRALVNDTSGWSYASIKKGEVILQLKLDTLAQPKTNLSEATFTVGRSQNSEALQKCMEAPQAAINQTDSVKKGGVNFVRSQYGDAGAGNFYQIRQFRALHQNTCYSIEEMVHSTNIHNYPASRGISAFDSARVWKTLNVAWETFTFTK